MSSGPAQRPSLDELRKQRIDREYRELNAVDPDLMRACVHAAEAVVFNNHRMLSALSDADRMKLAAAIEESLVSIATRARNG